MDDKFDKIKHPLWGYLKLPKAYIINKPISFVGSMKSKINLRFGNPAFLQEYWEKHKEYIEIYRLPYLEQTSSMSYHYEPIPELVEAIKDLHKQHKNAITDNKYLLLGNGATQVLTAIFHAMDVPVYANPPYYPRFPELSHLAQVYWIKNPTSLQIITNPNNPDCSITNMEETNKTLYDLSYNWSTYTTPINYNKDIMVFSLSKALGFASTRVGWALISDKSLYEKAKHYIEVSTSGVSIDAQHTAYKAIKYTIDIPSKAFELGKLILNSRWDDLESIKDLKFTILNSSGMFALCKGSIPDNIEVVKGTTMGLDSDEYFRINIGCSQKDFERLIYELSR